MVRGVMKGKEECTLILPAGHAGGEDDASDSAWLFLPSLWAEVKHRWMSGTKEDRRGKIQTPAAGCLLRD